MDFKIVGKRIKKTREDMKMSQTDLVVKSGVAQGMLSRIEGGKGRPTLPTLEKIAKALYVTTDYLLGIDSDPDYVEPEPKQVRNPVMQEVLDDDDYWKNRGIYPPTEEEKQHIINNYSFRLTYRNLDDLKQAYYDIIRFVIQRTRKLHHLVQHRMSTDSFNPLRKLPDSV